MIDVKQGATFEGGEGFLGLAAMIVGIFLTVYGFMHEFVAAVIGMFMVFVGLLLFMNIRGTQIDPAQQRIRPYQNLLGSRVGDWIPLPKPTSIRVTRYIGTYPSAGPVITGRVGRVKTYFITLWCGDQQFFLKESTSFNEALAIAENIAGRLEVPVEDRVERPRRRP